MEKEKSGANPVQSATELVGSETLVRHALDSIVSSKVFSQSDSLKRFLQHVVEARLEGRDRELKELTIGTDVFGRGDAYDPRIDPIVRVQATRLRSKLRDYYMEEGIADPVVIELPKGAYIPSFRRSDEEATDTPPAFDSSERLRALVLAVVILAAAAFLWVTIRGSDDVSAGDVRSIIVLPFTDMSAGQDQQFYGDGLADEITTTLAEARGLEVVPRMTAFAFRERDLASMHEGLGVDAALQGSVRQSEDVLRVTAQLIRTADGRQIWSDSFERTRDDAFEVQEAIARAVATAVETELLTDSSDPVRQAPEPAAYESYLRGRFALSQTTPASIDRSIEFFERATEIDPDFAEAYAGLVQAYVVNVLWGFTPPNETRQAAREAAEQALTLDANQPEALSAAAAFQLIYEWDLDAARQLLARADPENDEMHAVQGLLLVAEGRPSEARAELERATALSPYTPFLPYLAATAAYYAGDYEASLSMSESLRERGARLFVDATSRFSDSFAPGKVGTSSLGARRLRSVGGRDEPNGELPRGIPGACGP